MQIETLARLNEAKRNRKAAIILTALEGGDAITAASEELLFEADVTGAKASHRFSDALLKHLQSGKSGKLTADDGAEYFVNVHVPPPKLVVIGAVHISQALAPIARVAGFDMSVVDPRTAFASAERFPDCELHAEWPQDALVANPFDAYTAVAAVTHDPKIDDFPLGTALDAGCFYVGALGSRKTHAERLERLRDAGQDTAALARIHAPIGLDIGASSPAEIAVAIMAEVIGAFRRRGEALDSTAATSREAVA